MSVISVVMGVTAVIVGIPASSISPLQVQSKMHFEYLFSYDQDEGLNKESSVQSATGLEPSLLVAMSLKLK